MTFAKHVTARSMAGLRETLFTTIDKLISEDIDVQIAKSVISGASCIVNTVRVQVEYEQLRLESEVPAILPAMVLIPTAK